VAGAAGARAGTSLARPGCPLTGRRRTPWASPSTATTPAASRRAHRRTARGSTAPRRTRRASARSATTTSSAAAAPGQSERAQHDPRADGTDADDHEAKIANPSTSATAATACSRTACSTTRPSAAPRRTGLTIDVERHGHDRDEFQLRGGHAEHPAASYNHTANVKSTGDAGGNRSDEDRGDTGNS
jgi:hypothetical protein